MNRGRDIVANITANISSPTRNRQQSEGPNIVRALKFGLWEGKDIQQTEVHGLCRQAEFKGKRLLGLAGMKQFSLPLTVVSESHEQC